MTSPAPGMTRCRPKLSNTYRSPLSESSTMPFEEVTTPSISRSTAPLRASSTVMEPWEALSTYSRDPSALETTSLGRGWVT